MTCHNRKDKTVDCINHLLEAAKKCINKTGIDLFLTDDGSTDGTSGAVRNIFPDANIVKGDGSLYWAGGMRKAWQKAAKYNYDGYLLLNDDTKIYKNCLEELIYTHTYCNKKFQRGGVYVGSTQDPTTGKFTYGGHRIENMFWFSYSPIVPDGKCIKRCEMGNANIMLISSDAFLALGFFHDTYIHSKADFDYTLRALKKSIPVLVCANYCGICERDHTTQKPLYMLSYHERLNRVFSPLGYEYHAYMHFMKQFFPLRVPFVWVSIWTQVYLPFFGKGIQLIRKKFLKNYNL